MMRSFNDVLHVLGLCLLLLILSHSTVASAQRSGKRAFPPGLAEASLMERKAEALGLSEETLAELKTVIKEVHAEEEKLRRELDAARVGLQALLDEKRPDAKALMEASQALADIARRVRELRLGCSLKVRSLLAEEQLEKFMEIRGAARVPPRGPGGSR